MRRLLMIDDDDELVGMVREYLAPHGFEVDAVHRGDAGVDAVIETAPELVILDVMLPGIDGLEACRRIRAASAVPIVMLTARGDDTDRIVGLEIGADDYLAKPFNARELLARIRAVLRRSGAADPAGAGNVVRAGGLEIDPASRTVRLGERVVELTTAEFDVLFALASSAGHVLSREQLLERVHGEGWAAYDRSIDVHISRIRHKIERDPRHPELLKTVRGVGYQLVRTEPT